jgi:hypothetical protein
MAPDWKRGETSLWNGEVIYKLLTLDKCQCLMKCEINLNNIQKYSSYVTERTRISIRKVNFSEIMQSMGKSKVFNIISDGRYIKTHRFKGQYQ